MKRKGRIAVAGAAALLTLVVGVSLAQAGKIAEATFGGQGTTGGLFPKANDSPSGIATRHSTGQIYVVDREGDRVQRFDSALNFELAFGRDVIKTGAPGDLGDAFEVCTVAADCQAGSEGTFSDLPGGEFASPANIAIDQATGAIYVTTERVIQRFGLDDNGTPAELADDLPVFDRLWGWDVVQPGGVGEVLGDETQRISISPPAESGAFFLSFDGQKTEPVAFNATAAAVQSALEAVPNIAPGDVTVSGPAEGPWTVDFGGAYAGLNVTKLSSEKGTLKGFAQNNFDVFLTIETLQSGAGFEVCTVASQCQRPTESEAEAGVVTPFSIAVDPLSGNVFNANSAHDRISEYDSSGNFVRAFGWGVDTGADQFEICTQASKCQEGVKPPCPDPKKICPAPMPQNGQFGEDSTIVLAVDSTGVLYASSGKEGGSGHVFRFDTTAATPAGLLLPLTLTAVNPPSFWVATGWPASGVLPGVAVDIEIDPGSDNLYYYASGHGITEIDAASVPSSPTVVDTHMAGTGAFNGLGYDDLTDRLFVSAGFVDGTQVNRVIVAGNTGSPPPTLVVDPPSGIGPHQVTLKGEVTPNGPPSIETSYRFEYREVGASTWLKAPSTPVNLGDGNAPIPVEQTVAGLEACADHEVRLFAAKSFGGGTTISTPQVFKTTCIPPDLQTLPAQRVTDDEATLAGSLNPNNLPTTYRFEYLTEAEFGANGYANAISVPVPDGEANGGQFAKLAEDISGLTPLTAYRYRFQATNAQGTTVGEDVTFTTKATPSSEPPERGYEMVTPPFKVVRAAVWPSMPPGENPNVGIPSLSGETIVWKAPYFPLTDEVGSPGDGDKRMLRRHPQLGWVNETVNTLGLIAGDPMLIGQGIHAASGDLETQPMAVEGGVDLPGVGGLLPTEGNVANRFYTFRKGTGTEGYTPWLTNPEEQYEAVGGFGGSGFEDALVDDAGTALVRWSTYRGLGEDPETPGDDDPSDNETISGRLAYLQRSADPDLLPGAPKHLVSACTGAGATATLVPSLSGTETITTRECPTKTSTDMTSALGATVGADGGAAPFGGSTATALSDGGDRVFFTSPDPAIAPETCKAGATGTFTSCPPQLYVRQYDSEGNATVRWVSRSQGIVGAQKAAEMGRGAVFQGASRDGRYVYFKTNSPLLPTDPNGGVSITGGSASNNSWDLYRYELPASLDEDPANGTLTRVSGGPSGAADPSTTVIEDGIGAPLRFLSDDGKRAYFVTTAPIAGADETAPGGGSTTPGGEVGNAELRNLYLFDDSGEGGPEYRFVARLPYPTNNFNGPQQLINCATLPASTGPQLPNAGGQNCFRGTPDGSRVIFFTGGQLTADDNDEAGDIYLYDAGADELTRVSQPRAVSSPYECAEVGKPSAADCNADLGFTTVGVAAGGGGLPPLETARGWGGGRYYNIAEGKDGEVSVFFESRSELIAADTNGDHWDVYEWRQGKLRLLSPGDSADHTYFSGNSLDGEDVFIWTSKRIDPRELDPADFDLYDVRVEGGFPYTPPPTPCDVLALQCEGEALPAPPTRAPGSSGFQGTGNVIEKPRKPRCRKGQVRRKGRCVKRTAGKNRRNHSTKGDHR